MTPEERTARARLAAETRHRPDDPQTKQLAAEFKAERLAAYVKRVVDEAPVLTPAQRDSLALLLRTPVRDQAATAGAGGPE